MCTVSRSRSPARSRSRSTRRRRGKRPKPGPENPDRRCACGGRIDGSGFSATAVSCFACGRHGLCMPMGTATLGLRVDVLPPCRSGWERASRRDVGPRRLFTLDRAWPLDARCDLSLVVERAPSIPLGGRGNRRLGFGWLGGRTVASEPFHASGPGFCLEPCLCRVALSLGG